MSSLSPIDRSGSAQGAPRADWFSGVGEAIKQIFDRFHNRPSTLPPPAFGSPARPSSERGGSAPAAGSGGGTAKSGGTTVTVANPRQDIYNELVRLYGKDGLRTLGVKEGDPNSVSQDLVSRYTNGGSTALTKLIGDKLKTAPTPAAAPAAK